MKKFKNFGYKQETIEVREISMGNLVHIICQALIAKDKKDMEIRIVDCYAGEVDVYNGMEDLLMQDFIFDWKVNAYQIECLHNNKTDKDFLKVISRCKESGVTGEVVSIWAGHSLTGTITTTVYTHYSDEFHLKEAQKVDYLQFDLNT